MSALHRTVLLVDDDAGLLQLLSIRLRSAGFSVETASSAEQALARIAVSRPGAVVTDLRMEGMSGMDLFERIQSEDPALPVILLTAHGTIPDAVRATQRGLFGYLTKPFDDNALLELLQKALATPGSGDSADTASSEDQAWRSEIQTASPAMEALLADAGLVAASEASVLIQGPSGAGKEVLAQALHRASPRHKKPMVAINCAAIPEQLLESELFGHAKGAFTGATSAHKGLFQTGSGGTVFLDEIGDMPLALQAKLLRVLQDREIRPVGASQTIPVDVRIVSATHRNLENAIAAGEFREDLYYRLNVVTLTLPSLRQRREDIPLLARHFLTQLQAKHPHRAKDFTPEAMERLVAYDWPGNIRQLLNVVEQCCVLCTTALVPVTLVERALQQKSPSIRTYAEAKEAFERDYLVQLLKITNGQVTQAARLAGRNRTEFYRLLQRNHLTPGMFKEGGDKEGSDREEDDSEA
ncbi:sigma 54-interacting transcriptional regulator [Marinobacterium lutimaris]|uniref:Two-component system, NtrC family, response regulator GlrR n=1 Tax=Marinobacterium lutimaris TaxID=568106 RepID=A0A1H6AN95_9GAMM|nr:sigma 54-interacting transcriptional regulator [Marinobacterium lutimaris]SEG50213.1 two-component system, NtrC family, response regulator GlrR [Marinobacterium lutimaris]